MLFTRAMFDTLVLRHPYQHQAPREITKRFMHVDDRYVFNPRPAHGCTLPHLTWSSAPNGLCYLSAKASLPKMRFGNSVQMVTEADILPLLGRISDFASNAAGVYFDAPEAKVGRLDVCHNWQRTEVEVHQLLYALRNAYLPRMRRLIDGGTVYFQHSSERLVIYAKHSETAKLAQQGKTDDVVLRASVGVLRLEHRFSNSSACKRLAKHFQLPDRRAKHLLCAEVAERVINEAVMKLALDKPIESGDSRLALLREHYRDKWKVYERCAGFLALFDVHGEEGLIEVGYDRETIRRRRSEIEAAGAWLITPSRHTLAPLRLVRLSAAQNDFQSVVG